jgi:alpha-L-fucosidase 2
VLGNGKTGATVFGGVQSDQIYLNDATLWSGGPVDPNANPDVSSLIPQVREALAKEDYRTAERINRKIEGKFSESFSPLGTLYIEHKHQEVAGNYYRELDISKAIVQVRYDLDRVTYTREYFVSNPDKIMVIKLSASKEASLNFSVKFKSLLKYTTSAKDNNTLQANGYAPYYAYSDYMWNVRDAIRFDENKGTRFSTDVMVKNEGGQVSVSDSAVNVSNANEVVLYISVATSFNGFDKDPVKNGLDSNALADSQLDNACEKSYEALRDRHLKDFQPFFNRVKLELNESAAPKLPVDERLKRYTQGSIDSSLEALYFQYGRYLLISCSRSEGVPANLQGIWNPHIRPPWSCNYKMNINAEENYWLAECANLPEMHQPFLTFIERLAVTGKHTAKAYYGIDKGWAACHNSDIWAMSNPAGDHGKIPPRSCCWNMAGTWAVTHLWEHYLFTGDKKFLSEKAYPLMKGAAEFCLAWMVMDKQGYLITSPSTSPEAQYVTPDGFVGATLYGGTSDLAMIRECFEQTIKASQILNVDAGFRDNMKLALNQLHPYRIGKKGNLQEWYYDWEDQEPQHRHQTHLFGLYPGHHITPLKTPKLSEACRKTLEIRGDETTGWSKGWRINLWARLWDGNRAYKMFRELLTYVEPDDGKRINYTGGGGTYPNLRQRWF